MFRDFILLLQSLFCQGGQYTEQQYSHAINMKMNDLQAVYRDASSTYNADGTVTVTTANGNVIVIDPSETN